MPIQQSCRHPGCPELVRKGYCSEHTREVDEGYRKSHHSRDLYGSKLWHVRSKAFLAEHVVCVYCGTLATIVDHRHPVAEGGPFWDESNWDAVCATCHGRKTAEELRHRTFA